MPGKSFTLFWFARLVCAPSHFYCLLRQPAGSASQNYCVLAVIAYAGLQPLDHTSSTCCRTACGEPCIDLHVGIPCRMLHDQISRARRPYTRRKAAPCKVLRPHPLPNGVSPSRTPTDCVVASSVIQAVIPGSEHLRLGTCACSGRTSRHHDFRVEGGINVEFLWRTDHVVPRYSLS